MSQALCQELTNTFPQLNSTQSFEVNGCLYTFCQHHFIQDETGIETLSNLPKVTRLEVAELGIELFS